MENELGDELTKIDSSEPSGPGLYLVAGEDVAWGGPDTHFRKFKIGSDYLLHLKTETLMSYEFIRNFIRDLKERFPDERITVVHGGLDDDLKLYHVRLPYTFETMEF